MPMKRFVARMAAALTLTANLAATPAFAGAASEDLGRCMARASSDADKAVYVRWLFVVMSSSPAAKSLASIAPGERDAVNREMAGLVERLLLSDCHKQTIEAISSEGFGSMQTSFSVFDDLAMAALVSEPTVQNEMGRFVKEFDLEKFKSALKGVSPPSSQAVK
jgi:hypothetical protein